MQDCMQARTESVTIARPWREVYEFAAEPRNMPLWASGLGSALEPDGSGWLVQGPEGPVRVRFAPRNEFGVLDHVVELAPGVEITVPMRVVPNGAGAEVTVTLFRHPGMSAERFAEDAGWVQRDLDTLKQLLEGGLDGAEAG